MKVDAKPTIMSCDGLCKAYGAGALRRDVLRGVTLDVYPGEIAFILGPSGSGKSTLLSIIAGLLEPDAGSVLIRGRNLSAMSRSGRSAFRGGEIGVAPQRHHLLASLSARENAALGLFVQGESRSTALAAADRRLEALGLSERRHDKPRALSVGQRQRVAIARALAPNPSILLCDEPTAALDRVGAARLMALLREEAVAVGRATIIVTHDESLPIPSERVFELSDGRMRRREKMEATRCL